MPKSLSKNTIRKWVAVAKTTSDRRTVAHLGNNHSERACQRCNTILSFHRTDHLIGKALIVVLVSPFAYEGLPRRVPAAGAWILLIRAVDSLAVAAPTAALAYMVNREGISN